MIIKAFRPAIERIIEGIAAAALGGAVGFAVAQGAGWTVAGVSGVLVAGAALFTLSRIDRAGPAFADRFDVVDFPGEAKGVAGEDVLLLDDPLPALDQQSRVMRLFAAEPAAADDGAAPIAGPGEMVAQIEDFLGMTRGTAGSTGSTRQADRAASHEANAALHAALADIRRSLRRG